MMAGRNVRAKAASAAMRAGRPAPGWIGGAAKRTGARLSGAPGAKDDAKVLRALKSVDRANSRDALHSMLPVRVKAALPPDRFDAAIMRLSGARKIVIHHHDAPNFMGARSRAASVVHRDPVSGDRVHFHAVALPTGR